MVMRHALVLALLSGGIGLAGCSENPAPAASTSVQAAAPAATPGDDADITRAKLTAHGIPTQYSAHFEADKLARIDEQRQPQNGGVLDGEYTFAGARLIRYRGAKVAHAATLDLHFDQQGVLQSGQGPDVANEDITAIRDRAQLLRSHALAQRAKRNHSSY